MATTFREQVDEDFRDVFLNIEEFGRVRDWNGMSIVMVEGASPSPIESNEYGGVYLATKELYCRHGDLPRPPKPTEIVVLDGEQWITVDVKTLLGHYVIVLSRYAS